MIRSQVKNFKLSLIEFFIKDKCLIIEDHGTNNNIISLYNEALAIPIINMFEYEDGTFELVNEKDNIILKTLIDNYTNCNDNKLMYRFANVGVNINVIFITDEQKNQRELIKNLYKLV